MSGLSRIKAKVFEAARAVPLGRVTTFDAIASHLDVPPALVSRIIASLTPDEREFAPWHRIVAKGGAIGWGPNRDAHFAKLIREGVPVSPAGVVQDMAARVTLNFDPESARIIAQPPPPAANPHPHGRSRGMKDRP